MGLFALPLGKTKIDHIKSLECNVDIWLRYAERAEDLDYLLGAMQMCLDEARACAKQRVGLVTEQHQSLVSKQHQPKTKIDHIRGLKANIVLWLCPQLVNPFSSACIQKNLDGKLFRAFLPKSL